MNRNLLLIKHIYLLLLAIGCLLFINNINAKEVDKAKVDVNADTSINVDSIDLNTINWQTNNNAKTFADKNAVRGGLFRMMIADFPVTFRTVGPNANSSFRGFIDSNKLSVTAMHPQANEFIPSLATHWAIMPDNQTVLYKLNMNAKWSDGVPVTADDYVFTIEFMRSKYIVAPWYNNYYSKEITEVRKLADDIISVKIANKKPTEDMLYYASISPTPKHFHKLDKNWVSWANWKIEPVTGAYVIDNFRKGNYIEFKRVDNWWGDKERYFANRFNFERVRIKVIRNNNIAWNMFIKGELDSFPITLPEYWHERAKGGKFDKGWIDKYWFYNDIPRPSSGLYLNLDDDIFKDVRVRYAIAYALNIDKMNQLLLRGDYDRLPNIDTGYGEYTNPNISPKPFDIDKADKLLDEAGWQHKNAEGIREKDGKTLSFKINYSSPEHNARLALLREEALKAGIDMQLQLLTGASSYRNIMEKKHQAAWMAWSTNFRPDYWQGYHSINAHVPQTNNITNTDDKQMDSLIDAYQIAMTKQQRIKLAYQIQQRIVDIGAVIPTYMVPYTREAAWAYIRVPKNLPKTTDVIFDPMGLGLIWYDSNIKNKIEHGEKLLPISIKDETYRTNLPKTN